MLVHEQSMQALGLHAAVLSARVHFLAAAFPLARRPCQRALPATGVQAAHQIDPKPAHDDTAAANGCACYGALL